MDANDFILNRASDNLHLYNVGLNLSLLKNLQIYQMIITCY